MKAKRSRSNTATRLRRRAEDLLQEKVAELPASLGDDIQRLVHELQVHQIELELQNEELRNAQVELEDSRQKYVDLYDFAPVGYFTFDAKGVIVEVNLAGAALVGIERRHLIGRGFSAFFDDENQRTFYLHRQEVLETGNRQGCELKLLKKDGSQSNVFMKTIVKLSPNDENHEFRSAVTDITEKIKANEVLFESEEKYRGLFTEMVSGAALFEVKLDRKGQLMDARFLDINPAYEKILSIDRSQLLGKRIREIWPEYRRLLVRGFVLSGADRKTRPFGKLPSEYRAVLCTICLSTPSEDNWRSPSETLPIRNRSRRRFKALPGSPKKIPILSCGFLPAVNCFMPTRQRRCCWRAWVGSKNTPYRKRSSCR